MMSGGEFEGTCMHGFTNGALANITYGNYFRTFFPINGTHASYDPSHKWQFGQGATNNRGVGIFPMYRYLVPPCNCRRILAERLLEEERQRLIIL